MKHPMLIFLMVAVIIGPCSAMINGTNGTNTTNVTVAPTPAPPVTAAPEPPYDGTCYQRCCCKVCSSPSNEAFPYGLTTVNIQSNPINPQLVGASCHIPVWSERSYNDISGNPVSVPDTLWWTSFAVFETLERQSAPFTCDCCQFSGVDTSCSEERPAARRPQQFYLEGGYAQEYMPLAIVFQQGVELSVTDIVELRNDTHCGYSSPPAVLRNGSLTIRNGAEDNSENSEARWKIDRLPTNGCYRICYFHSTLTTPTWYTLGYVTVHNKPLDTIAHIVNPRDVLLEGNQVTITFKGKKLLSVFDDEVELRSSGVCGGGSPTMTTNAGADGILKVIGDTEWCKPPVVQPISTIRPLYRLPVTYSQCEAKNRLYHDEVIWNLELPAVGSDTGFTVCYRLGASDWHTVGTITVLNQLTKEAALQSLYTATDGPGWIGQREWGGSDACLYHGVRCNSGGEVTAVYLSRNNLVGTIPSSFFIAAYWNTLEHIALDMNTLSGTIPFEIGALRNLRLLDVGFNELTGTLPVSLQRTSLYILYVSNNQFDGSVPATLAEMQLLWEKITSITDAAAIPPPPGCPYDVLECSERGSTDTGVFSCGYEGITELECTVRGCCFNSQAPLVFGGSACFTKRSAFVNEFPTCTSTSCVKQIVSEEL